MTEKRTGKRPIDRLREGAGSIQLDTPGDDSAIEGMIAFDEQLLIVRGGGIYRVMLADEIDPERTNRDIPNTVQQVLAYGADSEWVGKSVLTAHYFLQKTCPPTGIDCDAAFQSILDFAGDLAGAHDIAQSYIDAEESIASTIELSKAADGSLVLPALGNVGARAKEFLQRADHGLQQLWSITKQFYPELRKGKGGWSRLAGIVEKEPKEKDNFRAFLSEMIPVMQMLRNARNCSEHPQPKQRIVVTDFRLDEKNRLHRPSIAVEHPDTPLPAVDVQGFFAQALVDLAHVAELLTVFLCSRRAPPVGGFPVHVIELAEGHRKYRHVRYSYGAVLNGRVARVG